LQPPWPFACWPPCWSCTGTRASDSTGPTKRIGGADKTKNRSRLHDEGFDAERLAFGTALKAASLTTELQRPRLDTLAKLDKRPPEKYRILSKLASQGLEVEEIAAILGISSVEAGQLLSLSAMAKYGR
jgi:hypothetical protein